MMGRGQYLQTGVILVPSNLWYCLQGPRCVSLGVINLAPSIYRILKGLECRFVHNTFKGEGKAYSGKLRPFKHKNRL